MSCQPSWTYWAPRCKSDGYMLVCDTDADRVPRVGVVNGRLMLGAPLLNLCAWLTGVSAQVRHRAPVHHQLHLYAAARQHNVRLLDWWLFRTRARSYSPIVHAWNARRFLLRALLQRSSTPHSHAMRLPDEHSDCPTPPLVPPTPPHPTPPHPTPHAHTQTHTYTPHMVA